MSHRERKQRRQVADWGSQCDPQALEVGWVVYGDSLGGTSKARRMTSTQPQLTPGSEPTPDTGNRPSMSPLLWPSLRHGDHGTLSNFPWGSISHLEHGREHTGQWVSLKDK